jgi:ATP-binding cassette subfamily C (CFTR/MRP) protein 1
MPFLNVGYSRPLEKDGVCISNSNLICLIIKLDLWEFPKNLQTSSIASEVEANFFQRCPPEQRPSFLRPDNPHSLSPPPYDEDAAKGVDLESNPKGGQRKGKKVVYDSSLVKALHQTFFYRWWFAGLLKLCSGATSGSLLTKHHG